MQPGAAEEIQPDDLDARVAVHACVDVRKATLVLLCACVGFEVALVVADYWINYLEVIDVSAIQRLFNNSREDSLASFFGVTQGVLLALTFWAVWFVSRRRGEAPRVAAGWLVLAAFFSWMAIDDGAMLHERIGTAAEVMIEPGRVLEGFPSYVWQAVFVPVFGALGLFCMLFLWTQLRGAGRVLMLVAMACLPLAVGLDFIEGLEDDHAWNLFGWAAEYYHLDDYTREASYPGGLETLRHFSRSIEETLEMFSATLLWFVLLRQLGAQMHELRVRLT